MGKTNRQEKSVCTFKGAMRKRMKYFDVTIKNTSFHKNHLQSNYVVRNTGIANINE